MKKTGTNTIVANRDRSLKFSERLADIQAATRDPYAEAALKARQEFDTAVLTAVAGRAHQMLKAITED